MPPILSPTRGQIRHRLLGLKIMVEFYPGCIRMTKAQKNAHRRLDCPAFLRALENRTD
jgi:hypothetical protein